MSDVDLSGGDKGIDGAIPSPADPKGAGKPKKRVARKPEASAVNDLTESVPQPPHAPASEDPFNPANLSRMRLSQDFSTMAAVKPVLTTIAARRPGRQEFVRVRPGSDFRFETGCFTEKETGETYLVAPELWPAMSDDVTPTVLVLAMSRNSTVPFLWPLTLPSSDGRPNRWHESAIDSARLAESTWVRVRADMSAGCYVPFAAAATLPEPVWPVDLAMADYLRLAFQGRFIQDLSHPCLKKLRGEI